MNKLPKNSQSGQVLLIILLIFAVSLTVGLSVISRSITDIEISQENEESARAFSAAEAGIEESLITGASSGTMTFSETGATYQTATATFGNGSAFAFPGEYRNSDTQSLLLASYNRGTEVYTKAYDRQGLRIVWGNQGGTDIPALEVLIYYKDGADYKIGRFALDPMSTRPTPNNFCQPGGCAPSVTNFTTVGETVDGKNFQYGANLNLTGFVGLNKTLLFARLRLLYSVNPQILGAVATGTVVSGTGNFPAQGLLISAVGQAGTATRKVEVRRLYPVPPAILDFSVFSGGSLVHQ